MVIMIFKILQDIKNSFIEMWTLKWGNFLGIVVALLGIVAIRVSSLETFQAFIITNIILLCGTAITILVEAAVKKDPTTKLYVANLVVILFGAAFGASINIACVAYGFKYAFPGEFLKRELQGGIGNVNGTLSYYSTFWTDFTMNL